MPSMTTKHGAGIRNAWCDCIRGYAIALVCVAHLIHVDPLSQRIGFLTRYFDPFTGVFMFYVLSGFLVTGILAREVEGHSERSFRVRAMGHFFMRRIFRLQPSYVLFLLLYAFFCRRHGGLSWWMLLLPVSNWFSGPYITWHIKTLHIEESYYVFIGTCSGMFQKLLRPMLWILLVGGPFGRLALLTANKFGGLDSGWWLDRFIPIEAFAVGGLLVLYLDRVQNWRLSKAINHNAGLSFAVALFALLGIAALKTIKPFSYFLVFMWPLLFSVFSAMMILCGLQKERFIFGPEWLRKVGLASYTVYLFQQFALGPWVSSFGSEFSWFQWCWVVVGTILLVPLWFRFVEKPLTDIGAKLFPRIAVKSTPERKPAEGLLLSV